MTTSSFPMRGFLAPRLRERVTHGFMYGVCTFGLVTTLTACHDLISATDLPPGVQSPEAYDSPSGAEQQATGALAAFRQVFIAASLLTDELTNPNPEGGDVIDQRRIPVGDAVNFAPLNTARLLANLAGGALDKYSKQTSPALRAEVLSAQGYTELELADQFCSGIPLSTIDYGENFTYGSPLTTLEVYRHATNLFQEAAPLAATRDSVVTFARVGWGRALLAQGLYDSAAHVVADVPTSSEYVIRRKSMAIHDAYVIPEREGRNGLPYLSAHDPRVPYRVTAVSYVGSTGNVIVDVSLPAADFEGDSVEIPVASGVEARLIEAEAVLQRALTTHTAADVEAWLDSLNKLRTTGDTDGTASLYQKDSVGVDGDGAVVYDSTFIRIDTLWRAGTGGVARLGPLSDPGQGRSTTAADSARVDLMFRERAFWLFWRGQRQGDLRRLIRQYHRTQGQVYPVGSYLSGGTYGSDVNFPVVDDKNPLFSGCLNRGA